MQHADFNKTILIPFLQSLQLGAVRERVRVRVRVRVRGTEAAALPGRSQPVTQAITCVSAATTYDACILNTTSAPVACEKGGPGEAATCPRA